MPDSSRRIFSRSSGSVRVQKSDEEDICVNSLEREDNTGKSKAVPHVQDK